MSNWKVTAAQRALELYDKMCRWDGIEGENNFHLLTMNNPYRPEFDACLAVVNSL
ncbi:hypothetical protein KAR91_22870 [Candidatus Pacearchaeota archaeon]|nr:hypothetical protein [Candidatus Pacearchaeota archaeon]